MITGKRMSGRNGRAARVAGVGIAALLALGVAGCKSKPAQAPIVTSSDTGGDPAAANLAPVSGQQTQVMGTNSSYTPQEQGETYQQQAPAPIVQGNPNDQYNYNYNAPGADEAEAQGEAALDQAETETDQPPPPLPDYDQPPPPDPNYLWTPGYWAWGSDGYYWVPGAWVAPPYYGALWTPPYWGWYGGHYYFHHGYWGPHVGFYGGVNYGFGYIGIGYFGGYWRGHDFYYNRAVTNAGRVPYVYSHPVVFNNRQYGARSGDRVSYNGGRGGLDVRPRPQELAAVRESHAAPVAEQRQVRQQAAQDRQNHFNLNHGNPAQTAFNRPVGNTRAIAEAPRAVQQEQRRDVQLQQRNAAEPQRAMEPNRTMEPNRSNGALQQPHPETPHGQPGVATRPGFAERPQPQVREQPQVRPEQRMQPTPRVNTAPMERPQPQVREQPQVRPEQRMQPQPQVNAAPMERPQPQVREQPQVRPQPQPQARPEPQRAPVERAPEPRPQAAPQRAAPPPPPAAHAAPQREERPH